MPIRKLKNIRPGVSGAIPLYSKMLSKGNEPHKPLVKKNHRKVGRGNGKITMRHRGGGHKRLYRDVDFFYNKRDMSGRVESVEYDPNRSSFISLVCYRDGERRYILTPKDIKVDDEIITQDKAPIKPGNRMKLLNIPVGTPIYNVEMKIGGGAKMGRSAGISLQLLAHDGKHAQLKMPSGEVRKVPVDCFASVGSVSNSVHHLKVIGKAGRSRWLGKRPTVRGTAMNPVDHPHGGGEGRAGRGRRRAVTKWGKPSGKGQKTRKPKKYSNPFIVRSRQKAKRKK